MGVWYGVVDQTTNDGFAILALKHIRSRNSVESVSPSVGEILLTLRRNKKF